MSDQPNALARLTWATAEGGDMLDCAGCGHRSRAGEAWLSVVIDVASFEFCGVLCEPCGKRLEEELNA